MADLLNPMILSGRLADWSLNDLLQILRITEKTATLEIEGNDNRGTLYFRDGRIIDAEVGSGGPGGETRDRIIETIYALQSLGDGAFAVGTHDRDTGTSLEVHEAVEVAESHSHAEKDLVASGILEGGSLSLTSVVESAVTLEPEQWISLAELVGSFTFDDVVKRLGRVRAVAFINGLRQLAAIGHADQDRPSRWPGSADEEAPDQVATLNASAGDEEDRDRDWDSDEESQLARIDHPVDEPGSVPVLSVVGETPEDSVPTQSEALAIVHLDEYEADTEDAGLPPSSIEGPVTRRREMKSVISPVDTTLVPGVLGDLRQRFRPVDDRRLS